MKNSQIIFFGRYEETRSKLKTVYRLTVYGGNSLCSIYSSDVVVENFAILQNSTVKL